MFEDEDLPKTKLPQIFPRKLEGLSVSQMQEYRAELEAEIAKIDTEIKGRGSLKAQAESLFK